MAKASGLGGNLYVSGYDLSGDISALSRVAGGPAQLDVTGINNSAHERLGALFSGEMSLQAFFNGAAAQEHAVFSALPTTDVLLSYFVGTSLGDAVASMVAKQINYDPTRAADGSLLEAIQALNNGTKVGLEWCRSLTAGKRTDTGATNGASVNDGSPPPATAVTITSSSVANPTVITATAHGLVTGDSVVIAGHTGSTPSINAEYTATVLTANTFTIPVNVTVGGTGGTVTKTSTSYGLSAYLHVFSFTGTSITVKIQDSMDDVTYADLAGAAFTAATGITSERIATATGATVRKYLRAVSSGIFNPCTFAVSYCRHSVSTL